MVYYTCEDSFEAMLSCIYTAWSSKRGHQNIKLLVEPVEQISLFDEYIHVDVNMDHAKRVIDAVNMKISSGFYQALAYTALAYEKDVLDNIYRCMIMGFAYGPQALQMVQYKDIMRNQLIRARLEKEVNRFQEVIRFHQVGEVYVAHFEPKSRIAIALGPIFEDRMPSESFIIVDDAHKEAVIHPKDEHFYMRKLNQQEFIRLLETEQVNDDITDLWRAFFKKISIEERKNEKCQQQLFPLWTRKNAVEFS